MDQQRFNEITGQFQEQSILVVGDLMLDQYFWGKAERISPEAPVPIVRIESINNMPGGAGNVALNLAQLNCRTRIVGLIGDDEQGKKLTEKLDQAGIATNGLTVCLGRPTTVKTRIIAQNQQILRTDREELSPIDSGWVEKLIQQVIKAIPDSDGIIIADYDKGVLSKAMIVNLLEEASNNDVPVYVDPKTSNFFTYQNIRLFKPNKDEFLNALGTTDNTESEFKLLGEELVHRLNAEIVMVTLGDKGVSLFYNDEFHTISTKARKVHDVTGAGDTMIAVFTLADLTGASPVESAQIANYAAGRVIAEVGAVPINHQMLHEIFDSHL
ncbi:MAG: D-glycero-beta-D-manno-heptose-7-phosphate kinase [Candidatus Marinimicrobia bacterium]|nr:D-glycero-beta-D-manno-heptose-7-phosphate kinase [Candidatus Neomarinimicrobiota bacterium]